MWRQRSAFGVHLAILEDRKGLMNLKEVNVGSSKRDDWQAEDNIEVVARYQGSFSIFTNYGLG